MHKLGDTATTEEEEEKFRRIKEKIRSIVAAERGAAREINSGSRLGNVLRQANRDDRSALGALAKGYNVMQAPNGYHVVLSRTALTASKEIRPAGGRWK